MQELLWSAATRFARDESGATAIEYAVVATGIAMALVTTINALGGTVFASYYNRIAEEFRAASGG